MIKITCETKKEKEQLNNLLRLGEFTALGAEIIMKADIPRLNRRDIKFEIKESDMAREKKALILKLEKLRPYTCAGNPCYNDCDFYANGAYGTGCALDIVIGEIERRII